MSPLAYRIPPSRRLVIVEDEAILALDIQRSLTQAGFDVRGVAADADAAVALVERERPDLVLMDIRIQGTRDGIETAALLKERFDVPVVYLTAHSDPKTMERAQRTEPMGYLLKPFKKPDLHNVVTIALARSENERDLRRREQVLSTTLACIGEAIVSTDSAGQVTYLNPAAEELVGRSSATSLRQPLARVVPLRNLEGGPLREDPVQAAQERGQVAVEGTLPRPGGARSVVGTAAALRQGTHQFGVVLALKDLTELFAARKHLEFTERLTSLGTLAAGVAHEVNNPLSVVVANIAFALSTDEVPPGETRDALGDAQDAAQRMGLIISELHAFSGPQVEPLKTMDPREALGSALTLTRAQWRRVAGISLDLQPIPLVLASSHRLTQVFVTLLINAVQAMEELPGPHSLRLSTATDPQGRAVVTVSDTGPGIKDELRFRIFEPFFTTKPPGKGTGLGLAIARSIVENHDGEMMVGPGPGGVGASFTMVLPSAGADEREQVPLDAWWVGERCAESEALCPGKLLSGKGGDSLGAALQAEVVFLAVPEERAHGLIDALPELEGRALRVSEEVPPVGVLVLRRPFDARAVVALVRRGETQPRRH